MRIIGSGGVILAVAALATITRSCPADEEPIQPKTVVPLFNGRNLDGLYHWLKDSKYDDPQHVYSVKDGMLHISGAGDGYIGTRQPYRDYRLVVEYRWGRETFGAKGVRNSGILLHGVGPDGSAEGIWLTSIECQVAQGCVGDLIVIPGADAAAKPFPATFSSETVVAGDGNTRWQRGGERRNYTGKQFWWSKHEPGFEELIDTRGKDDVDSPLGEWTRVECICRRDRITILVNGVTVNECFDCRPSAGKIMLECEQFEIDFRKFELHPLDESE
jgi:hypothetical protein